MINSNYLNLLIIFQTISRKRILCRIHVVRPSLYFIYINIFTRDVEAHLYRSGNFRSRSYLAEMRDPIVPYRGTGRGFRSLTLT